MLEVTPKYAEIPALSILGMVEDFLIDSKATKTRDTSYS